MVALLLALAAPLLLVGLALALAALRPGARPSLRVRDPRALRLPVSAALPRDDAVVVLPPERARALHR